jgi:hypothetical protein
MTRWFNVAATLYQSELVKLEGDEENLIGDALREAVISRARFDAETADIADVLLTEVENDAGKVT